MFFNPATAVSLVPAPAGRHTFETGESPLHHVTKVWLPSAVSRAILDMAVDSGDRMADQARINSPLGVNRETISQVRECRFALEPSLDRLVELADKAGWTKREIAVALALYADSVFDDANKEPLQ